MKFLGIVRWKRNDKNGNPFAGVEPLEEVVEDNWRRVDATKEFPTGGQAFWFAAREANEEGLVFFRTEENPGHKEKFRVVDAQRALEIVDLREFGSPASVKAAFSYGIRNSDIPEGLALVRCAPDILVGPVKLHRRPDRKVTFEHPSPDRVPCFRDVVGRATHLTHDGKNPRRILTLPLEEMPLGAPTAYVDWDEDRRVVRRAINAAVVRAKSAGVDHGLTKRLIDEAAAAVTPEGGGAEIELERYRLERAKELSASSQQVVQLADNVAAALLTHPVIEASLEALRKSREAEWEASFRAELDARLTGARKEMKDIDLRVAQSRVALSSISSELEEARNALLNARQHTATQVEDLDEELSRRLAEIVKRPAGVLSDVAILRSFLSGSGGGTANERTSPPAIEEAIWVPASVCIENRLELQKCLFAAFKAYGVAPAHAIRIHAALVAGVLPVVTGAGALAALTAYAQVVCGGRIAVIHIGPDSLSPISFRMRDVDRALERSRALGVPAMLILEGANRGPTEAYLTPFLQELAITFANRTGESHVEILWAATAVGGATTIPVSRDLWSHAMAIYVEKTPPIGVVPGLSDVGSELLCPADEPEGVVDEIVAAWPPAREVAAGLRAFARGLSHFESDASRVSRGLAESILLPLIASTHSDEERVAAFESLATIKGILKESIPDLEDLERQLRWRLA